MPALPTTGLKLHCDASDTDQLFTTYSGSGVHSGTPGDGDAVQVWDDEGDGVSDIALVYETGGSEPSYRSATPLMALPCLDFNGSVDRLGTYDQTGTSGRSISNFMAADQFTVLVAFYAESVTLNGALYTNHGILADTGGYWGILLRDNSGTPTLTLYNYDGSEDYLEIACSVNASHVLMARHVGGNIYLSLDGGSESSLASGNTGSLAGRLLVGSGYSSLYNGRIGEFAIYNVDKGATGDHLTYFTDKWLPAAGFDPAAGFPWPLQIPQPKQRYEVIAY